ncbi:unnamed protein product [Ilex paraguariensis]|uniref:Auxin-responsive protein n=1 Tax=Ilex paraguariensis TaxID=185542 RepID=A0ABC8TYH7_9AQUA
MEGYRRKDEVCPQLLDLIPKEREWVVKGEEKRSHGLSEDKKLELRLGPPGDDWTTKNTSKTNPVQGDESLHTIGYPNTSSSAKRGYIEASWIMNNKGSQSQKFSSSESPTETVLPSPWSSSGNYQVKAQQQQTKAPFLQLKSTPQSLPVMAKESSQPCCTKVVDLQSAEKKTFSPAPANTAVPNSSQKRSAPTSVVGWPPIRSFRKNLASSNSSKPSPECQKVVPNKVANEKPLGTGPKGLFVKINMDGVPIGRKVNLKAYDCYDKLSSAVDELFRDLLAAQRDPSAGGIDNNQVDKKPITGLSDGSGEFTLVYEDNEGDGMLVGDVPWHMFVSTVKRLRVLKSSELTTLCLGSKQEKLPLDAS